MRVPFRMREVQGSDPYLETGYADVIYIYIYIYILFDSIRLLRQAVFPKFGNLFCKVQNILKSIYIITVLGFALYTYF